MYLTISTTSNPAQDLGYLLMKNPARLHTVELSFGNAHIFYPEATEERTTCCLFVDVDAVELVRGKSFESATVESYVNDRPYVASSFLSVAIARCFGTALSGRSKERQELADQALPFEVKVCVLPCRGGESFLRSLFEPLGYEVEAARYPLDPRFPEWGDSRYFDLTLKGQVKLADLLSHLYVLIPVLDDEKHYFVDQAEVDKLLRHGEGWLSSHPAREAISLRYLAHKKSLSRLALQRLVQDDTPDDETTESLSREDAVERPLSLNEQRMNAVVDALKEAGVRKVVDLGCGEGKLLKMLLEERQFAEILGVDVSCRVLERAAQKLRLEKLSDHFRKRITLLQGSLVYRDDRLQGYDAACCIEVIEHLDADRVPYLERAVFEFARPRLAIFTTPNVEYNVKFETLAKGKMRHEDHRFEWTRRQFEDWAQSMCNRFGYTVRFAPVGPVDDVLGPPTQMGIFTRES